MEIHEERHTKIDIDEFKSGTTNITQIVTVGGGDYHHVKKLASLCSSSVCFFGCFRSFKKLGLPHKKTILAGALELDPLLMDRGYLVMQMNWPILVMDKSHKLIK